MPSIGYLVLVGNFDVKFLIFTIPFFFYGIFFINNVEIPDTESDSLGGKKTWIISYGRELGFMVIASAAVLATISFIIFNFINVYPKAINFFIIAFLSLIPLFSGVRSFLKKSAHRVSATKLVNLNLSALILFLILLNCYFIYLCVVG